MFFKNRKGMALPMVIIAMAVLILLGIALYGLAVSEAKQSEWQIDDTQAQYLGQSGVSAGMKIMTYELASGTFNDTPSIVTYLNNLIANRKLTNPNEFQIAGVGTYTIVYEAVDAINMKILSVGTAGNSSKTVTLTNRLSIPPTTVANPANWVSGINLTHSVNPVNANYLQKIVTLVGNPIQSPQGGNVPSTFQASAIAFTDYNGQSFRQVNNSIDVTFDSEVLYFQSASLLNTINPNDVATKNDVLFGFSDTITANRPAGRLTFAGAVGFEDVSRYNAFINGIPSTGGYVSYSGTYATEYNFLPGQRYGVVYFGGNLTGYNGVTIPSGYYFYASGVGGTTPTSLKGSNLITNRLLIPVKSDDILIPAVETLFKLTVGSTEPQMWDNK